MHHSAAWLYAHQSRIHRISFEECMCELTSSFYAAAAGNSKGNELLLAGRIRKAAIELLQERARQAIAGAAAASARRPLQAACHERNPVLFRLVFIRIISAVLCVAAQAWRLLSRSAHDVCDAAEDGLRQLGEEAALSQPEESPHAAGAAGGPPGATVLAGAAVALPMLHLAPSPPLPTKVARRLP